MKTMKKPLIMVLIVMFLALAGAVAVGGFGKVVITPILNTYARINSYIYWRQFTCDKLVPTGAIVRLMTEHKDVVQEIAKLRHDTAIGVPKELRNSVYSTAVEDVPFNVGMRIIVREHLKCPGKGYIEIQGGGESARDRIKEIMNGKTFFGVPCNMMRNQ